HIAPLMEREDAIRAVDPGAEVDVAVDVEAAVGEVDLAADTAAHLAEAEQALPLDPSPGRDVARGFIDEVPATERQVAEHRHRQRDPCAGGEREAGVRDRVLLAWERARGRRWIEERRVMFERVRRAAREGDDHPPVDREDVRGKQLRGRDEEPGRIQPEAEADSCQVESWEQGDRRGERY